MFDIEITYRTGNSFGSSTEVDLLGCSFSTIEEAKEALKCIREHNEHFDELDSYYFRRSKKEKIDPTDKSWFCNDYGSGEYSLYVKGAGEIRKISAFWRGYFEDLISAEIKVDQSDLIYEP